MKNKMGINQRFEFLRGLQRLVYRLDLHTDLWEKAHYLKFKPHTMHQKISAGHKSMYLLDFPEKEMFILMEWLLKEFWWTFEKACRNVLIEQTLKLQYLEKIRKKFDFYLPLD
jgi:hypothetical protein